MHIEVMRQVKCGLIGVFVGLLELWKHIEYHIRNIERDVCDKHCHKARFMNFTNKSIIEIPVTISALSIGMFVAPR